MTKAPIHVVLLAALALAASGCTTSTSIPTAVTSIVADVQALTAEACAFVPDAAAIIAIIASGSTSAQSDAQMAQSICSVVTKPTSTTRRTAAQWIYPGTNVVITGKFAN